MLKEKEAVIFDLDGTLVDSMWMWRQIDIDFLEARGIPFPEDLQNCIEGLSFYETAVYFKKRFQLEDSVEELMQIWNDMAMEKYEKQVPMKDGVIEFLSYLKEHGIKMGIATSNSRELLSAALSAHDLWPFMDAVVTSNEVTHGKPAPDIYLKVAEELVVHPDKCLVFEDLVAGIQAGSSAGMQVCAVWDSYSKDQQKEKKEAANYYIRSYFDVLKNDYEVLK